jgi:hypothetical protein
MSPQACPLPPPAPQRAALSSPQRAALSSPQRAALFSPQRVVLFSGHMIDAPDRAEPRFPPEKEAAAASRIAQALADIGLGTGDLALAQAAAGGDLLFLEAALARGAQLQILLPFDEAAFIARSIAPSINGEQWRRRYAAIKAAAPGAVREMPAELGPLPPGANAYERGNDWLLQSALAWGGEKLRFVCLWNGADGDGPGGTRHLMDEVKRRSGRVTWIDTRTL